MKNDDIVEQEKEIPEELWGAIRVDTFIKPVLNSFEVNVLPDQAFVPVRFLR